jgi:Zn-dependent peptidase ImmA (M78 family)
LNYIKCKTNEIIKKYKTNNPFEIADLLGINVKTFDFPTEVKGIYQYEKKNKFIYLNRQLSYHEKMYVCGHELGHAVLHTKINCTFLKQYTLFNVNKFEHEANQFCSYLLIPDDVLKQYSEHSLEYIAATFNIPVELLMIR